MQRSGRTSIFIFFVLRRLSTMNERLLRAVIGATIAFALVGCDAYGPIDSPDYSVHVESAVADSDGIPQMSGAGIWYPHTRGFDEVRDPMLIRPPDPVSGTLVITDKSVLFARWDEARRRFVVVHRIAMQDIESASVDRFGAGRRLVLRKRNRWHDSFEFVNTAEHLVDAEKVERAAMLVRTPRRSDAFQESRQ